MRLALLRSPTSHEPTEAELRGSLAGLDVFRWSDEPDAFYAPHTHDRDETICLVAGEITFTVDDRDYTLRPGDRLLLPAGTVHAARAGQAGATYLIAS